MRLATRTGLAAFAAALLAATLIGVVVQVRFARVLEQNTDSQLDERRVTAPVLVAVADRLERSELNAIVEGARIALTDGGEQRVVNVGQLPDDELPAPTSAPRADGFRTVSADGQRWRLLDVAVTDVPAAGDVAVVQLVVPLGDVDSRTRQLRRQLTFVGLIVAGLAGCFGYVLGRRAARPLSRLRANAEAIDHAAPRSWQVDSASGAPDVDDVADALNRTLERLADESTQRGVALDAARAFASSAAHELRTPLQSALTNLDIAGSPAADGQTVGESVELARRQLTRAANGLAAIRALANAELADPSWFEPCDLDALIDLVERAVADEVRQAADEPTVVIAPAPPDPSPPAPAMVWCDGVQLAVANLVRNAIVHGARSQIVVTVGATSITVNDAGPGIAPADRERVLGRFERGNGPSTHSGSKLGLAIVNQVAHAHGGSVTITDAPAGGARVVLTLTSL